MYLIQLNRFNSTKNNYTVNTRRQYGMFTFWTTRRCKLLFYTCAKHEYWINLFSYCWHCHCRSWNRHCHFRCHCLWCSFLDSTSRKTKGKMMTTIEILELMLSCVYIVISLSICQSLQWSYSVSLFFLLTPTGTINLYLIAQWNLNDVWIPPPKKNHFILHIFVGYRPFFLNQFTTDVLIA